MKPEARLVDTGGDLLGAEVDAGAQRLKHIRAATAAAHRAIAVLSDAQPRAGRHKRCRRGDVERRSRVAAGAAGVDERACAAHRQRLLAHHPHHAAASCRGLAAQAQRRQQGAKLRRRGLAGHHLAHDRVRLIFGKVATLVDQRLQSCADHERSPPCCEPAAGFSRQLCPAYARKLRRRGPLPFGVMIDSG